MQSNLLTIVLCFVSAFWASDAAAHPLRLVARSGDHVPGVGGGSVLRSLGPPSPLLNGLGRTAFLAGITGGLNATGYVAEVEGPGLTLMAREGQVAPGAASGVRFSLFNSYPLGFSDDGRLSFTSLTDTPNDPGSYEGYGLWSTTSAGGIALEALTDAQAPGVPSGVHFGNQIAAVFNSAGQIAFRNNLAGPGVTVANDGGIWVRGDRGLELAIREGNVAPGTSLTFTTLGIPVLNDSGVAAFSAMLMGGSQGIWTGSNANGFHRAALRGDSAPGTPGGVTFREFKEQQPSLNNAGEIAFLADLQGAGVTSSNRNGLWTNGGGGPLRLVARTGDQAPGADSGATFRQLGTMFPAERPLLNGAGRVAFAATLTGPGVNELNDIGIWTEDDGGSLTLVARMGDPAAGTADGVLFDHFVNSLIFNAAGQVAFTAYTRENGVSTNNKGIWAHDRDGALRLIALEGEMLEVSPGDFREIELLRFDGVSGNEDGLSSSFNNHGQVAFAAKFTDSTWGVFVSDAVSVFSESGDFNDDGDVDGADFLVWQRGVGTANGATRAEGDANGDGAVTAADLKLWKDQAGKPAAAATIPEPTMPTLLLVGVAVVELMRRRSRS